MPDILTYIGAGAAACAAAYLIGSISFAVVLTQIFIRKDIRTLGSNNAGMTNVLRSVGVLPAVLTLLLDVGKAIAAVFLGRFLFTLISGADGIYGGYAAGLGVIIGHSFPLYFKFKGGKGVLTALGTMIVLEPTVALLAAVVFLIVLAISKIVSLSSIAAAFSLPIISNVLLKLRESEYVLFVTISTAVIAIVIISLHHKNILRLLAGTERRLSVAKKQS